MDTNTLFSGIIGGVLTLVAKYIVDRLTEVYKTGLSLAAKRREKFDEKQAMVIAGIHHKLHRCVEDLSELYFHGDEGTLDPTISRAIENQLDARLAKARKSFERLEAFHSKYGLYLPQSLDDSVSRVILLADSHLDKFTFAFANEFEELKQNVVETIKDLRFDNIIVLLELKKQFRQLLVDEPSAGVMKKLSKHLRNFADRFRRHRKMN